MHDATEGFVANALSAHSHSILTERKCRFFSGLVLRAINLGVPRIELSEVL